MSNEARTGTHVTTGRQECKDTGHPTFYEGRDYVSESFGPPPQMTGSSATEQQTATMDDPFMRAAGIR